MLFMSEITNKYMRNEFMIMLIESVNLYYIIMIIVKTLLEIRLLLLLRFYLQRIRHTAKL